MATYTIKAGDTLSSIASELGTNVQTLENLNPGVNPDDLQIGQAINVPTAPVPEPQPTSNGYVPFSGPASNFPDQSTWADYQSLWDFNSSIMPSIGFSGLEDISTSVDIIGTWIPSIAAESGVDARVILCIIMQESGANVLVHSTNSPGPNSVNNTGIMQAHDGVSGVTLQQEPWPVPVTSIGQMIRDGTEGTATGPGLMQLFQKWGNWYEAAREYNSGQVDVTNLSNGSGATDSYVSDVANRLLNHVWPNM